MEENDAPKSRKNSEPKAPRRYSEKPKAKRYAPPERRRSRRDAEAGEITAPAGSRGRREYYRKKEVLRKKRARRRAFVVLFSIIAALVTIAIIAVFVLKGCSADKQMGEITETIAVTQPATQPPYTPVAEKLPELDDNGADGYMDGSLYIWNSMGFDIFKGDEKSALVYSSAIADAKKALGNDITVYNMVVPNHTAYGLPDRILSNLDTNAQRDNTTVIYSNYGEHVVPIDVYNAIGAKRCEYIFYNTDNRWTSYGAYQAYAEFARTAGIEPIALDGLKKNKIENYGGSYVKSTGNLDLLANPDTIEYYEIPGKYKCSVIERNSDGTISQEAKSAEMYKTEFDEDEDELNVFICGDNPLFMIDNEDKNDGNRLLVVKDTFGSAIVPFLASNYDEVYVIDFRYYSGSIKEYCNKKGIKNVLFVNGIMSANSAAQINKLKECF